MTFAWGIVFVQVGAVLYSEPGQSGAATANIDEIYPTEFPKQSGCGDNGPVCGHSFGSIFHV
jgi:hypothetical protein